MKNKLPESWEDKIRLDYKGILSDEQIEVGVQYWKGIIAQALQSQREELLDSFEDIIGEDEPEMTPNFFSDNWINHKNIYRNELRSELQDKITALRSSEEK